MKLRCNLSFHCSSNFSHLLGSQKQTSYMKHKTCCSFIRRHFLLHHLLQSTRLFIITSIIIKSKTTISRTPYSSKFHSLGVIPPHLAPPFLHRLSNVFNVQSTVGFPSFALTSLCLSQTQTLGLISAF